MCEVTEYVQSSAEKCRLKKLSTKIVALNRQKVAPKQKQSRFSFAVHCPLQDVNANHR
jgi:hypothetical protein